MVQCWGRNTTAPIEADDIGPSVARIISPINNEAAAQIAWEGPHIEPQPSGDGAGHDAFE
jgi:hypothetical protein